VFQRKAWAAETFQIKSSCAFRSVPSSVHAPGIGKNCVWNCPRQAWRRSEPQRPHDRSRKTDHHGEDWPVPGNLLRSGRFQPPRDHTGRLSWFREYVLSCVRWDVTTKDFNCFVLFFAQARAFFRQSAPASTVTFTAPVYEGFTRCSKGEFARQT